MQRITPNQALLQRLSTKCFAYMTSGKITNSTDVSRVAELLSESNAFYDVEMISELMNTMLQHTYNNAINRVNAVKVRNVMNQLKAVRVFIL